MIGAAVVNSIGVLLPAALSSLDSFWKRNAITSASDGFQEASVLRSRISFMTSFTRAALIWSGKFSTSPKRKVTRQRSILLTSTLTTLKYQISTRVVNKAKEMTSRKDLKFRPARITPK